MSKNQYPLKGIKAEYFTGPISDNSNGFRTIPQLLRCVADWMDETDLQDPEFQMLDVGLTFISESPTDDFYQHVTVYYRDENEKVDVKS